MLCLLQLAGTHDNTLKVRLDIPGRGKGVISLKVLCILYLPFVLPPSLQDDYSQDPDGAHHSTTISKDLRACAA